ncbi:hypothetical protein CTI12_AA376090 [Artemisia annua]|uniref:Reverse transcriptase zinc-binding domain-containing protein n=1 Tax=Artemisia annua TaxID=35608 RepID=A0A2U1MIJ9_ARTAN|nr:hypothetical protein CTI12_AA376090 [Artemisia annua]
MPLILDISWAVDEFVREPSRRAALTWLRKDRLPTRSNLDARGIDIDSLRCPVCNDAIESTTHLFVECTVAADIWSRIKDWWGLTPEKLNLVHLGNTMVKELFEQIGPNENENLCILSYFDSVSTLYRDFDNHEVVGGAVMTFVVTQSPVLEILSNMNISHEWDYLEGLRMLQPFMC